MAAKQRCLRSWWRHEQQTVAAVLATVTHHSHSKVGTANAALRDRILAPAPRWVLPSVVSSRQMMAGPRGWSGQRHCWSPGRRGSCSGTPSSGTRLSRVSMFLCRRWRNSCRISSSSLPHSDLFLRRLCRDTQLAEQLVEVPTIVSYSSLQRTVEHHADIPVPGREGRASGLQVSSRTGFNSVAVISETHF